MNYPRNPPPFRNRENHRYPTSRDRRRPGPSKTKRLMLCLVGFAALLLVANGGHMRSVIDHGASIGPGGSEADLLGVLSLLMLGAVFLVGVKIFLNPPD